MPEIERVRDDIFDVYHSHVGTADLSAWECFCKAVAITKSLVGPRPGTLSHRVSDPSSLASSQLQSLSVLVSHTVAVYQSLGVIKPASLSVGSLIQSDHQVLINTSRILVDI